MNQLVIMTATMKDGEDAPRFDRLSLRERRVVVDVDTPEVWLSIEGPLVFDALSEGVCRPLNALIGEAGQGAAMVPISWLETAIPDVTEDLATIRDSALAAAREAVGMRLN